MEENDSINDDQFTHLPVMAKEIVESIKNLPQDALNKGLIIDATVGGGGHSAELLTSYPNLRLIGLDQDPLAIEATKKRLKGFGERVKIIHTNFAEFDPPEKAALVLADLGVSSPQLDLPSRGFSFRLDGPLDMRMNPLKGVTAAELLINLSEKELADILFNFGEEKLSRKIAKRIKKDISIYGPYEGTAALAYAIAGCYPPKLRHRKIHPATRSFQALRIAVNNEIFVLKEFLDRVPNWLIPEGFLALISFHSLEDRLVKNSFKSDARLERITKKPLIAKEEELYLNPRSRSAKCRIAKRI